MTERITMVKHRQGISEGQDHARDTHFAGRGDTDLPIPHATMDGFPLPIRRSVSVGASTDPAEFEAERTAQTVVNILRDRMSHSSAADDPPSLQPDFVRPDVQRLRRFAAPYGEQGGDLDQETEAAVHGLRGTGRALPGAVRRTMESAFGVDLSDVRVHAGGQAAALNERLGARAFTLGNDIVFGDGMPDAGRPAGQHLLAHELTHVLQQRRGDVLGRLRRRALAARPPQGPARNGSEPANLRGAALIRRMALNGTSWRRGLKPELHAGYDKLLSNGEKLDEKTGMMVNDWKTYSAQLSVEDLEELLTILEKGAVHLIPKEDLQKLSEEIKRRKDPGWIAAQKLMDEERKTRQSVRETRLLTQGQAKLGGKGDTWQQREPEIQAWFKRLKAAEASETWDGVFKANRMSARQIGAKSKSSDGGAFPARNVWDPNNKARDREITLDRGASGITARSTPENFYDPKTEKRGKNAQGLHDLSASLLDCKKPILSQLKGYKDSSVVFMPVPAEDDMQIFNAVANLKDPDLKEYRKLKSKMTRIKLAQGSDMHTRPFDVSKSATDPAKIRYGVTGLTQRSKTEDERPIDETDLLARKSNALEHSSILGAGAIQPVNEIVMAYRAHESKVFPVFAKWDSVKRYFRVTTEDGKPTSFCITDNGEWTKG